MQATQSYQTYAQVAALYDRARATAERRGAAWCRSTLGGVRLRDMTAAQLEAFLALPEPPPPAPSRDELLRRHVRAYRRAEVRGNTAGQEKATEAVLDLVLA